MNTKNNKRKRESRAKIESVFVELLQTKELDQVTVSDICSLAGLNRSTFYANYMNIYELADIVRGSLEQSVSELYRDEVENSFNSNDYLKLFRHIADNQLFYKTYFKLGYDNQFKIVKYDTKLAANHFENRFVHYHIEFFRSGFNAIVKMWLAGGCIETPEEMNEIIQSEYKGRTEFFQKD
ncbi:TetR/AcrR family transcriptional regulator [Massiliimalia massiliensis]|uniref:TetR/AcrR family transcriptional regulator n=1 Tax=Massiliimalia massiliensis TaxID=1852384 RepID=UPI0009859035|nr:TetR/AcrR family transcriptional regulator [Massiliimalia massiliensis]